MIRHRKKLKNKKMEDLELEIQKLRDENKDFSNRLINLQYRIDRLFDIIENIDHPKT